MSSLNDCWLGIVLYYVFVWTTTTLGKLWYFYGRLTFKVVRISVKTSQLVSKVLQILISHLFCVFSWEHPFGSHSARRWCLTLNWVHRWLHCVGPWFRLVYEKLAVNRFAEGVSSSVRLGLNFTQVWCWNVVTLSKLVHQTERTISTTQT